MGVRGKDTNRNVVVLVVVGECQMRWGMSDALGEVSWLGVKIVSISVIRNSG